MSILHKILGISISTDDKTRFTKVKAQTKKVKKERTQKENVAKAGNKNLSGD